MQRNILAIVIAVMAVIIVSLITTVIVIAIKKRTPPESVTLVNESPCKNGSEEAEVIRKVESNICSNHACIEASNRLFRNMDTTADPCDDFNQFACGGFIKNEFVPPNEKLIGTWNTAKNLAWQRKIALLTSEPSDQDFESDNKVRDLYHACINRMQSPKEYMRDHTENQLGKWPLFVAKGKWTDTEFEWYKYIEKKSELGLDTSEIMIATLRPRPESKTKIDIYIEPPIIDARLMNARGTEQYDDLMVTNVIYILDDSRNYQHDISEVIDTEKTEEAKDIAKEILEFEIKLASLFNTSDYLSYRNATVAEFGKLLEYQGDVKQFLRSLVGDQIRIEDEDTIHYSDYIRNMLPLLASKDKRIIANYLSWKTLKPIVEYTYYQCDNLFLNNLALTGLISSMYIRNYFKEDHIKDVIKISQEVLKSYKTIFKQTDWLDEDTKRGVMLKLNSIMLYIAEYQATGNNTFRPREFLNKTVIDEYYTELEVFPNNHFKNLENLLKFSSQKNKEKFVYYVYNGPHWTDFGLPRVTTVDPYYQYFLGETILDERIYIQAGLLQDVFYNKDAPQYMNFGAIGALIGHEIGHAFDNKGKMFHFKGKHFYEKK